MSCPTDSLSRGKTLEEEEEEVFPRIKMSSGFITESEVALVRQKRQEEWEKVRKADDPMERPEEPYDNRSLFDRLQEQKQKKDLEYEEAHKLKNMIKGLDDDEIEFLDLVDRTKMAADRNKELEEERELNDYRNRVAELQEKAIEERLQAEITVNKPKVPLNNHTSQQKLLKGVVVKKRKLSDEPDVKEEKQPKIEVINTSPGMKCVAILPGLGHYDNSSSDESSSESDDEAQPEKMDILGRKILCKKEDKE